MYSSNYFEINYRNSKIKMSVPNKLKLNLTGYLDSGMFSILKITNKQKDKCQVENGAGLN